MVRQEAPKMQRARAARPRGRQFRGGLGRKSCMCFNRQWFLSVIWGKFGGFQRDLTAMMENN
jgi:hypothetical protein